MKTALVVLDGMGLAQDPSGNAVTAGSMPFIFSKMEQIGYASLAASGSAVGLRADIVGNSEVGHLTIGAGQKVLSTLSRMDMAYEDASWKEHPLWQAFGSSKRCHVVGLLSDAGVHGHLDTMWRGAELAISSGCPQVVVHPVLDGVDSPARSAPKLLQCLMSKLASLPQAELGMVMGRKCFCDRSGASEPAERFIGALKAMEGLPEFKPEQMDGVENERDFPAHGHSGVASAVPGEPVFLTSHRGDRALQVARALARDFDVYAPIALPGAVPREQAFFPFVPLKQGLASELAKAGVKTTRIAEDCKFPHVTSFFDGLNDAIVSQKLAIPTAAEADLPRKPEMAVDDVVDAAIRGFRTGESDFIVMNIANLDQIGHLGKLDLAITAARKVDTAVHRLFEAAQAHDWTLIFVADHGNADRVETPDGLPYGSHTDRPVPLIVIPSPDLNSTWLSKEGSLANVAATVLASMGRTPPAYMQSSLVEFQPQFAKAL